ncbi:MAG: class I SAM-dependent methyltransferase [Eubacteriales bacterium]|jgi:hypothetical protein
MKKSDLSRLSLFLAGIASKLDTPDDFVSCTVTFRSGGKAFPGVLTYTDAYRYTFCGVTRTVTPVDFAKAVSDDAARYDALTLVLRERGSATTLTADARGVRTERTAEPLPDDDETDSAYNTRLLSQREYILRPDRAAPLLKAIGLMADDGKLKNDRVRKLNQIEMFLDRVRPTLEALDVPTVEVLDCACGKSYLSFALNYFLRDVMHKKCYVTGVDISEDVIRESTRIAEALGYRNMRFIREDLSVYIPDRKPTLVVSLHACDTATDMALGLAIREQAPAIACVPCCHKELLSSFRAPGVDAFTSHGILRARLNDVLTDGLRVLKLESVGYDVRVVEYVSPLDTPRNLLITARRTASDNPRARQAYNDMCRTMGVCPAIERYAVMNPDP